MFNIRQICGDFFVAKIIQVFSNYLRAFRKFVLYSDMEQQHFKQERKVIHLQLGELHEYFGSIEQMFCKYTKEDIGFSIYQVRNNLKNKGSLISDKSIIRFGILQTKSKKD